MPDNTLKNNEGIEGFPLEQPVGVKDEESGGKYPIRQEVPSGVPFQVTTFNRYIQIEVFAPTTDVATGDGKKYVHIPPLFEGLHLIYVHARVITAGTTGTTDIQIANVTDSVDMLSTKITIDSTETGSETAATAPVINMANDMVQENDLLRVDVDAVSTTAAKGLIVTLGFRKP